jgi:hypothetical protein
MHVMTLKCRREIASAALVLMSISSFAWVGSERSRACRANLRRPSRQVPM